jgi:hypothetical protein
MVFLGRKGAASAWRVHERQGGVVLFLVPMDQLKDVVLGMRLNQPLVGADAWRHEEMCQLLTSIGLASYASRNRHGAPAPPKRRPGQMLRPPSDEPES